MSSPVDQPLLIEIIIGLVALETVLLTALWRLRGMGIAPGRILPTLAAGAFLLLALREALLDGPWHRIWLWLTLSLVAHVVDVIGRWRARDGEASARRKS